MLCAICYVLDSNELILTIVAVSSLVSRSIQRLGVEASRVKMNLRAIREGSDVAAIELLLKAEYRNIGRKRLAVTISAIGPARNTLAEPSPSIITQESGK